MLESACTGDRTANGSAICLQSEVGGVWMAAVGLSPGCSENVFRDSQWHQAQEWAFAGKGAFMGWGHEHDAVRKVVIDYLEGMVWGDEERLRRAFHPGALQVGHFADTYEFFPLGEFIDWLKQEETMAPGTPYVAELLSIEVTGTVAIAKLTDTCFGTDFTDYLVMVKDRPDHTGRWQIVTKAYHVHSGRGLPPSTS